MKHISNEYKQIGYGMRERLPAIENSKFKLSKTSFRAFLQQYELYPEQDFVDIEEFFSFYKSEIFNLIKILIESMKSIKVQFCLQATFRRESGEITTYTISFFCSENFILTKESDFEIIFKNVVSHIDNAVQHFESLGSGWVLDEIDRLDIRIGIYKPLKGSCEKNSLPTELKNKRGIISVKSNDNRCFIWCILSIHC